MERRTLVTMFANHYPIYVLLGCASLLLARGVSRAGDIPFDESLILVDHQPFNTGGPAADTALRLVAGGDVLSQILADQFRLETATPVGSIVWWGFYGGTFINVEEPPPDFQTFRMRVYEARAGDGLPDRIVAERQFENPTFAPTGRPVLTSVLPPEFRFEATLNDPLMLTPATDYWFEVTQLGDPDSHFRWVISRSITDGHVFFNAASPDWQIPNSDSSLAFQLIAVPEPTALVVLLFPVGQLVVRRRRFEGRKNRMT